jgi:hypothetical protein
MNQIAIALLTGALLTGPGLAQQTSTTQTNPTQNKDIPKQEPGDNNPDLAPQSHPVPNAPSGKSSGTTSRKRHARSRTNRKNIRGSSGSQTTSTQI